MKYPKHFSKKELECPCCHQAEMDEVFLNMLETIRVTLNKPIAVESGYRCAKHNAEVGGKRNSAHLLGKAADIRVASSNDRAIIIHTCFVIGITRIGIGKNYLHIDNADESTGHPKWQIWHYYG